MTRKFTNLNTGEIIQLENYSKTDYKNWMIINLDAIGKIADDPEISKEAYRIFMSILSLLKYGNSVQINQKELAKKLNLKAPNISRGLKLLVDKKIICKIDDKQNYSLNRFYGFKGISHNSSNVS